MTKEKYIAALDISSSKITGVVGVIHPGGHADIIAAEQERHLDVVRYGHIQNLEETSRRVAKVIENLERNPHVAPRKISSVFVGLNGMSMRSLTTPVSMKLAEDTEITTEILNRLREQALNTAIDNSLEVVDAVDRVYTVGRSETHTPKGAIGNSISAIYDLMVCRPGLRRNISRTVADKLGLKVHYMVTALATGLVVLGEDEKRHGCMLVDMGAETTTVTIYRKGFLAYLATIPMGARNITRDLTHLNLLEERAEEIKKTSGNALPIEAGMNLNLGGIRLSDISSYIVARSEEIVANILEQLTYAGMTEKDIPGGIICIGGGAKLEGMTELLHRQSSLPVTLGRLPAYIRVESPHIPVYDIIPVVSLLYAGGDLSEEGCLAEPAPVEMPKTDEYEPEPEPEPSRKRQKKQPQSGGGFMGRFKKSLTSLFVPKDTDDDDADLYDDD